MRQTKIDSQESTRFRVLRLLERNPTMSYREIASELGVSVGGVHYCLKALVDKGMVKIENFKAADNKWRYTYVVTPQGLGARAVLAGRFLQRKLAEYESLKTEIEMIQQELKDKRGLK